MKVLVTGSNGFIGKHWIDQLQSMGAVVVATGSGAVRRDLQAVPGLSYRSLDITDPKAVNDLLRSEHPDAILHAAAISKPDVCEQDHSLAERVNVAGTRNLLAGAEGVGAYFCLVSTDFVFDGEIGMYRESDPPAPINFYGLTKLRAEQLVQQYSYAWSIARTVTVYGPPVSGRPNLLSIVVDKLSRGESYSVVDDQFRTPTYAGDLAWGVASLIQNRHDGIFHISGEEGMTPYQMAIQAARHVGLDPRGLLRVTADTFQQPARRPKRTGFVIEKAKRVLGFQPRSFAEGLQMSFPRK